MSFLAPLFLVGALAGTLPIVLHLLKREPDARVRFSAVRFLRNAPVEHASRRHLRELLLLAIRVAALLLLAFAFARPFLVSGAVLGTIETTVIALDTSLSLGAPGQFEKARELAKQAINRAGGPVAIVTFDDVARVASEPSRDRALAMAAVDAARPGAGGTSYRAAIDVSAGLLRGEAGTIVIVSDLQASGWDGGVRPALPDSAHLEIADVGAPPPNLAVTAAHIVGERVVVSVRNTAPDARPAHVTLSSAAAPGGATMATATRAADVTVPLGAGETKDVEFPAPRGTFAVAVVDDPQGAPADNARYVVLDLASRPTVLVVTASGDLSRDGFYVAQALAASGADGRAYEVEGVTGAGLQAWDQPRFNAHAAVVLLSTRGFEHHGRSLLESYVQNGGGVLVAAGAEVEGDVVAEALGDTAVGIIAPTETSGNASSARTLTPADLRHPVFRPFAERSSLGLVTFRRVSAIRASACQTLARFSTGETALVDCLEGQGRALLLASDVDNRWNDFPVHATFVPFMHEAVKYLSGTRKSSGYLVAHAPAGVPSVPGVFPLASPTGGQPRLVAVNVDPLEAEPGRLTAQEFQAGVTHAEGGQGTRGGQVGQATQGQGGQEEERQHIWQYVLAMMAALLVVESAVASRTA